MQFSAIVPATLILLSHMASATSGFINSCSKIGTNTVAGSGVFLTASCANGHGGRNNAKLKLGICLGNDNGQLVAQKNGAFGSSCTNCGGPSGGADHGNADPLLSCRCKNDAGNYVNSSYNLNNIVGNVGGNLECNVP